MLQLVRASALASLMVFQIEKYQLIRKTEEEKINE